MSLNVMTSSGSSTSKSFYNFLTPSDFDEDNAEVSASVVWDGLKENTTAHGIPHITHAKGPIKKAFWCLITAITVSALLYNLFAITKSYFSFKVDVTIKLRHENELTFPAVTVCNMSPVKKSAFTETTSSRVRRKRSVSLCTDGWFEYLNRCYWATNETNSYLESADHCLGLGGQLAPIRNEDEYIFVKSVSTGTGSGQYWFGLYYDNVTSTWTWPDGTNATFFNWTSGQPTAGQPCVFLTEEGYTSSQCEDQYRFICVKDQEVNSEADQSVETTCCCTCCPAGGSDFCGTCSGPNATDAAHCAATRVPTPPPTTTTAPPITTTTAEPQPVPGSQFPERMLPREDFRQEEKLTETLAGLDESEKRSMGYSSVELVLDCQYSGYTCDISEFSTFYNPILGNCYVFNSGWTNASLPLKKSLKAGRRHGLHLIININQDEYVQEVGDTAGLRLVIHPQNRMPFPEDEGITVSPGHATSVGIKQVALGRVSYPYSDCVDPEVDRSDINVYEELFPKTRYSANACQRTCYQKHVIQECGCGDPTEPLKGKAIGAENTSVKPCDSSNITQDDCRYKIRLLYNNNSLHCYCPDLCRDTSYSLEVSLGEWPSNVQKDPLLEELAPQIGNSFDIHDPEEYKENLAKVEVYYEEFNYEQIQERPSYPASNYLSDIGGVLGLWVGFSILTIFEFVELAMDLVVIMFRKCWPRKLKKDAAGSNRCAPNGRGLDLGRKKMGAKTAQSEVKRSRDKFAALPMRSMRSASREILTRHSISEENGLTAPGGMNEQWPIPDQHRRHSPSIPYSYSQQGSISSTKRSSLI